MISKYPANLTIDYREKLGRLSTFFRGIIAIPILTISGPLAYGFAALNMYNMTAPIFIIISLLFFAMAALIPAVTGSNFPAWLPFIYLAYIPLYMVFSPLVLMILFKKKYPRWWYDWGIGVTQFMFRVRAFLLFLTDKYPSTDDEQLVHVVIEYPDAEKDLRRGLPLVKWFLAIPHYIILWFLGIAVWFVAVIAWFAILFTRSYPRGLFNFAVGYERWNLRVWTYVILLTTDRYPPFSLK
jgi:hypothetical protein